MIALSIIFWIAWAFIVYTYILFPLILTAIVRVHRAGAPPAAPNNELPFVTIVVAAHNEQDVIANKLLNTWELDYPEDRLQIVIGSDGSTDNTVAILTQCADSRLRTVAFEKRRGKISVLNDIMQTITGGIVVMSDANTMFDRASIRLLVRHFSDPRVGCVSGRVCLDQSGDTSGEGLYWKYETWIKRNESQLGFLIGCNGGIYALRSELYQSLPTNTLIEDFVISMRIIERGWRVVYEPVARGFEPPCVSAQAEMTRKIRIGAGGFQALRMMKSLLNPRYGVRWFAYVGHKVMRWFVPLFIIAAFISACLLAPLSGFYGYVVLAMLAGAALSLYVYRLPAGRRPPKWALPFSYFYLMNYALFRGLIRYLFGTQRVTWERAESTEATARRIASVSADADPRPLTQLANTPPEDRSPVSV